MDAVEERLLRAKEDKDEMDRMLRDYLPFIRKQLSCVPSSSPEYEDLLSIAMMVFADCIGRYEPGRGNFFVFAQTCIRNRLADEGRRAKRLPERAVDLSGADAEAVIREVSISTFHREGEARDLCGEIEEYSLKLDEYGVSFFDLPNSCPRQKRARKLCYEAARYIQEQPEMRDQLERRHQLGQTGIAEHFSVSVKTIEKHRRYIVALYVLLNGDYPCIRAFLPWERRRP